MAFVMLAYAHAAMCGIDEARGWLAETFEVAEKRFWESLVGLYADEATVDWVLSPYRGQNANMHACEAMLAAFAATGEARYIERAETLAEAITRRQAALADDLVWEHYNADWTVDWDYNRHDRSNIFRPWGYQPGHLTEWAKLLVQLDALHPAAWHLPRAEALFLAAVERAWDHEHGGMSTVLRPTVRSATATSTTGCRPKRSPPPRCLPCAPATATTGRGTTASGTIAGSISSITAGAPGSASSMRRTATTPAKRARPARSIITTSVLVSTSRLRCASGPAANG